jgi:hypothetical protein
MWTDRDVHIRGRSPVPQPPRELKPWAGTRDFFGAEVRHWRLARGMTQDELGRVLHVSGDSIAKIEKAERWPPAGFAADCDRALFTGGILARLLPLLEEERRRRPSPGGGHEPGANHPILGSGGPDVDNPASEADSTPAGVPSHRGPVGTIDLRLSAEGQVFAVVDRRMFLVSGLAAAAGPWARAEPLQLAPDLSDLAQAARVRWPGTRLLGAASSDGADATLVLPGGVTFEGARASVRLARAQPAGAGHVELAAADRAGDARLLAGSIGTPDGPRFYAVDAAAVRRGTTDSACLRVPVAYELDDLTYAALWAATNLDDALLASDTSLDDARRRMRPASWRAGSEAAHEQIAGLRGPAQMWLGSDFCAQHILHNLDDHRDSPVFWTREQRGEEASTWLLFRHKQDYLHATSAFFRRSGARMPARIFCLPENVVEATHKPERILLLLAVAQMEASGVRAVVTVDPAYTEVPGFLIGNAEQTLVATWVRDAKAWHVDPSPGTSRSRELHQVIGDSLNDSLLPTGTSAGRLEHLAHYLGLDWRWLRRRAGQLADSGWGGLINPRSRLLSAHGLDVACRHLAALGA